jgi:hypothetical protein
MVEQGMDIKISKDAVIISTTKAELFYDQARKSHECIEYMEPYPAIEAFAIYQLIFLPYDYMTKKTGTEWWAPIYRNKYMTFEQLEKQFKGWPKFGINRKEIVNKINNELSSIIFNMAKKGLIHIYNKSQI